MGSRHRSGTSGRGRLAPRPARLAAGSRRRALTLTVVGLVAVVAAGYLVSRSGLFAARSIVVEGNAHLTREQVLNLGRVGPDTNLVWFSQASVEEHLEASPWVLRATVERAFPSSLRISVVERVAVAVAGKPERFLIAADRTILGPAGDDVALPFVETAQAGLTAGERLEAQASALVAVAALPASLRGQVRRARFDEHGTLTMALRGGATAIYGDATQAEAKGLALQALLRWADRNDVVPDTLDVRAPSRPALLPAGVSTEPTIVSSPQ